MCKFNSFFCNKNQSDATYLSSFFDIKPTKIGKFASLIFIVMNRRNNSKIIFFIIIVMFTVCFADAQTKKWTISDCVNYAIEHNISILQAKLEEQSALIDQKAAKGNFYPSLNANTSHSWNIGLNQNITTGLLENQTTQFTSAGINSNIVIYNGLQNQNRLRVAHLTLIAAQYKSTKIKDDVSLNVANAYLQILFNKENLKVRQQQQQNNEKQLQRTQELVAIGTLPRGDLLDIKATLASNKQQVIMAENALFISKLSLAQLLQLSDYQNFDIEDINSDIKSSAVLIQSPATIFEKAKSQRAEIMISKTNLDIAQKELLIAKGALKPSLQGFYSFSTRASYSDRIVGLDAFGKPILSGPAPLFDQFSNNKGHSFGMQLNIPIFNGFATKNIVERNKINIARSTMALNQQETDLERNIYTAFSDANGAIKTYESAISTLEARTEAYLYAKEKFAVGMLNSFDLNQSQTLFATAESEVLRTKYDAVFRIKIIEFYFGIPINQN